jgi:hypothetical protein
MRRLVVVVSLALAGCATTPEGRLRQTLVTDVYWDAARECEHRFRSLHLKTLGTNGDLDLDVDAGQTHDIPAFAQCYWAGIEKRVDARRTAGLPMPATFEMHPEVGGAPE